MRRKVEKKPRNRGNGGEREREREFLTGYIDFHVIRID